MRRIITSCFFLLGLAIALIGCTQAPAHTENNEQQGGTPPEQPAATTDIAVNVEGEYEDCRVLGDEIAEHFTETMQNAGYITADVTDWNREIYPDSTVLQAGDGHVTVFLLNGSVNDAETFWFNSYYHGLRDAASDEFIQKFEPDDFQRPRSVEAVVDGEFFRCDIIGHVAILGNGQNSEQTQSAIAYAFDQIGVPENNNVVS